MLPAEETFVSTRVQSLHKKSLSQFESFKVRWDRVLGSQWVCGTGQDENNTSKSY